MENLRAHRKLVLAIIALGWTLPDKERPAGRLPKYNPERRKTFAMADWTYVCRTTSMRFAAEGAPELAAWAEVAANKALEGIPYRVPKRFKVMIYEKRLEGYKQVNEGQEPEVTIADPDHLNWISFKGLPLSNGNTSLAFNQDGTLKSATLTSASTVPATLNAAGGAATTVSTAVEGLDTARQAEKTANATSATGKASFAIAADKAYQAAKEAEQRNRTY